MARRQIAQHNYINGGWGCQTAQLYRDQQGFILYDGWSDGCRFSTWRQAKSAWLRLLSSLAT